MSSFSIETDPFFADDLRQMANAKNYMRWQFDLIAPFVHGACLEVGGGIGNFTPRLAAVADSVTSIEPNEFCRQQLNGATAGLANVTVAAATAEELAKQATQEAHFDSAVCMNVLEHIEDDHAALRTMHRLLKPGGHAALLIPALPALFGEIDQRLGHYRRYSKKTARAAFEQAGFSMKKMRYFNPIGAAAWWWNAHVGGAGKQSDFQIKIFDGYIVPWQRRLESLIPVPLGQSLLAVGRKEAR